MAKLSVIRVNDLQITHLDCTLLLDVNKKENLLLPPFRIWVWNVLC